MKINKKLLLVVLALVTLNGCNNYTSGDTSGTSESEEVKKTGLALLVNEEEVEYTYNSVESTYSLFDTHFDKDDVISIADYDNEKTYTYDNGTILTSGNYDVVVYLNNGESTLSTKLIYEDIIVGEYAESVTEEVDDKTDLVALKNAFDAVSSNYTMDTQTYFNRAAVDIINKIYSTSYYQKKTTKVTENGVHVSNLTGEVNETYAVSEYKTLSILDSTYVDTYGYKQDSKYTYEGWTKIASDEYKCDRTEVVNDFRELLTPGLSNAGTYMTYKYVTVKLNSDGTLKLRLYCSTTQSGKLIPEHKEQEEKPNWYMLLSEANVYNIGNTTI